MRLNRVWVIFALGMIPFILGYWPLKVALNSYVFVGAAIVYLIALRLLAEKLARSLGHPEDGDISGRSFYGASGTKSVRLGRRLYSDSPRQFRHRLVWP